MKPHDIRSLLACSLALGLLPAREGAQFAVDPTAGAASTGISVYGTGETAAKPDLAKGQAKSNEVCVACHTNDGSRGSPANPILQGQHPEYLIKQLTEFKAGKRENPIMKGMASALSDEDIRNCRNWAASV